MMLRRGQLTIEEIERPVPGENQVLARVIACGICGSDLHAAKYLDEMIAASKRSGRTAWDTIAPEKGMVMGHEFIAEVVERGPGAEAWAPGTRVTGMPVLPSPQAPNGFYSIGYSPETPGAYGEYVLMGSQLLLPVPDGVPSRVAAMTEPCAVGLHTARQARMQPGEHAVVMGAGPVGLFTTLWLKKEGVPHVTVSDPAAPRRELAKTLGADLVVNPAREDLAEAVIAAAGRAAPVVFECVGVEGTLQSAMELVARQGRVVVAGVCMREDTVLPMVGTNKHLTVQFVLGYTAQEFAESLAALSDGSLNASPMVTRTITLDELPGAFDSLADPRDCKVMLEF
jgi:threonine dehydrogenase-like Zn-dependent dehydrogenase